MQNAFRAARVREQAPADHRAPNWERIAQSSTWFRFNFPQIKQIADAALGEDEARKKVAALCAEQVLDSARVSAGSIDDPRAMLQRMNEICEAALNK